MNKYTLSKFKIFRQRKTSVVIASVIGIAVIAILTAYTDGPARNNQTVTGAPFNNNQTCSKCHGGGQFGGAIITKLLDASNLPVTSYVPNQLYTFRVKITKTSTQTEKYGLQTTCATVSTSKNINKWGTLPTGFHKKALSNHSYVEQSSPRTKGTFSFPWTAPAAGTGSITFYTAAAVVNNNGSSSGDQSVNTSLTINEQVMLLPVTFSSFKGTIQKNKVTVTWTTILENKIKSYTVEKSYNGVDYSEIGSVPAKGGGDYTFTDNNFNKKAYYRLKLTDADGNISHYNALTLTIPDKSNYQLSLYAHAGAAFINFHNGAQQQKVQIIYMNIQGNPLYSYITEACEGDNMWPIQQDKINGITIINVVTADGIRTSLKLGIN